MTTRLIGDIHGKFDQYLEIADIDYPTVQVGDFGVGFDGQYWHVSKRQEINGTEFICLGELDYIDLEI